MSFSGCCVVLQIIAYGRAAACVQGCSFPITRDYSPQQLKQLLPAVGETMADIMAEMADTGTCQQLEAFRRNGMVRRGEEEGWVGGRRGWRRCLDQRRIS